ncbi:threonine--tRNA ligase, chloroplastic/mitochondrial 2 [Senna tora]|uniref:Threonine--tRNA ligase, chloroplastic/mitochondrial 2 n=1 Tax=Senna tora TaxID=362788 RepID=A0A834WKT7_9FABA|nr:threonine--tRNA ligase, chloroplastic/mitochondrial 2 [Senna tora]
MKYFDLSVHFGKPLIVRYLDKQRNTIHLGILRVKAYQDVQTGQLSRLDRIWRDPTDGMASLFVYRLNQVLEYCNDVTNKLKANGIRAEICHGERLPKLIRNAEKQKIPLMAVVGQKEVETQTVTVRSRFGGEIGTMSVDDFISRIMFGTEGAASL